METKLFKRLPYGNSDFRNIMLRNYACIDKTRFIEELEKEDNRNHFLFTPAERPSLSESCAACVCRKKQV
ncbi:MAG: AAA family ATPase [Tannerella sp.]|jgi:hypothetical protein|nr:AAA family ATPase [Tannerella sp.]